MICFPIHSQVSPQLTGLKISTCFVFQRIALRGLQIALVFNDLEDVSTADRTPDLQMFYFQLHWALLNTKWFVFEWIRRHLHSWKESRSPNGLLQMNAALWITKCFVFKWIRRYLNSWQYSRSPKSLFSNELSSSPKQEQKSGDWLDRPCEHSMYSYWLH